MQSYELHVAELIKLDQVNKDRYISQLIEIVNMHANENFLFINNARSLRKAVTDYLINNLEQPDIRKKIIVDGNGKDILDENNPIVRWLKTPSNASGTRIVLGETNSYNRLNEAVNTPVDAVSILPSRPTTPVRHNRRTDSDVFTFTPNPSTPKPKQTAKKVAPGIKQSSSSPPIWRRTSPARHSKNPPHKKKDVSFGEKVAAGVSGFFAGAVAGFFKAPYELVKATVVKGWNDFKNGNAREKAKVLFKAGIGLAVGIIAAVYLPVVYLVPSIVGAVVHGSNCAVKGMKHGFKGVADGIDNYSTLDAIGSLGKLTESKINYKTSGAEVSRKHSYDRLYRRMGCTNRVRKAREDSQLDLITQQEPTTPRKIKVEGSDLNHITIEPQPEHSITPSSRK